MNHISPTTEKTLSAIGLSDPEIAVYLALLELGPQPASVVAKRAKLKRGHTYNVLEDLTKKGIVQEFEKEKIKRFAGCPPESLLTILNRREEEVQHQKQQLTEVLTDLEKMRNPAAAQAKIRFFQGPAGVKQMYEDTIREQSKPIHAFVDFAHCFPGEHNLELNEWMWRYTQRRADRDVEYRGIAVKSDVSDMAYERREREKRTLKMLEDMEMPVEINIYENKVAIVSSSMDMVGLMIEDEPTATALRSIHQAMWKLLPEYE